MKITQRAKALGLGVVALGAAVALAACGGGGGIEGGGGNRRRRRRVKYRAAALRRHDDLQLAALHRQDRPSPNFEKATGVKTNYIEDVNDNQEFFAKMQPLLAKGESGGRSIIVVTDWMAKKMHDLGYVQNLDPAGIPNVEKNLRRQPQERQLRPGPQVLASRGRAGMTGLIVNTAAGPGRPLDQRPVRPASTRARSRC